MMYRYIHFETVMVGQRVWPRLHVMLSNDGVMVG